MGALSLRRARQARGLTTTDIAAATHLSPRVIAAIEEDRFENLPAGIYARRAVQAYGRAVGLDTDEVLAELGPLLPDAPLDLLVLADLRTSRERQTAGRHGLAVIIDAAVLMSIALVILVVCAAACDVSPSHLLLAAPVPMLILCSTPVALYFWLLGATGVRTVGPWLLDLEILPPVSGPLSLSDLLHRGVVYARRELTLVFRREELG